MLSPGISVFISYIYFPIILLGFRYSASSIPSISSAGVAIGAGSIPSISPVISYPFLFILLFINSVLLKIFYTTILIIIQSRERYIEVFIII